jgi:hypothetical protein
MQVKVVSYSLTGNNVALANKIATGLGIGHVCLTEPKRRSKGSIFMDILLNRAPSVNPHANVLQYTDLVILVAPVWIGHIATPLRTYLQHIKINNCRYAFVSISGGVEGSNPGLRKELIKRTGKEPEALINFHIPDLAPAGAKILPKDVLTYRVTNDDAENLFNKCRQALLDVINKPQPAQIAATRITNHSPNILRKVLLLCGIGSSLLYVAMNILIPPFFVGYKAASQTVSELSAIGTTTRALWMPPAIVYTLLVAAFGWGVWLSKAYGRRLPTVGKLLVIYGVAGLFWPPMHQRAVLASGGATVSDTMHLVFAGITVLLMFLAITFGAGAFRKSFCVYSIVTMLAMLVLGILTAIAAPAVQANLPTPFAGVWERINIGLFLLWIVVLAIKLLRPQQAQGSNIH